MRHLSGKSLAAFVASRRERLPDSEIYLVANLFPMIAEQLFMVRAKGFDDRLVRAHHPCRTPRMMASPHAFD
jgi:hypothetical protein